MEEDCYWEYALMGDDRYHTDACWRNPKRIAAQSNPDPEGSVWDE